MTQFICQCGQKISLTVDPNKSDGSLIWDDDFAKWQIRRSQEIAKFITSLLRGNAESFIRQFYQTKKIENINPEEVVEDILSQTDQYSLNIVRCQKCRRIYIQKRPGTNKYESFIKI